MLPSTAASTTEQRPVKQQNNAWDASRLTAFTDEITAELQLDSRAAAAAFVPAEAWQVEYWRKQDNDSPPQQPQQQPQQQQQAREQQTAACKNCWTAEMRLSSDWTQACLEHCRPRPPPSLPPAMAPPYPPGDAPPQPRPEHCAFFCDADTCDPEAYPECASCNEWAGCAPSPPVPPVPPPPPSSPPPSPPAPPPSAPPVPFPPRHFLLLRPSPPAAAGTKHEPQALPSTLVRHEQHLQLHQHQGQHPPPPLPSHADGGGQQHLHLHGWQTHQSPPPPTLLLASPFALAFLGCTVGLALLVVAHQYHRVLQLMLQQQTRQDPDGSGIKNRRLAMEEED